MTTPMFRATVAILTLSANAGWMTPVLADSYKLDVKTNMSKSRLDGDLSLHYENRFHEAIKRVRLRLDPNVSSKSSLEILSIKGIDGRDLPWRFSPFRFGKWSPEKAVVEIDLPQPLAPADQFEMQLRFTLKNKKYVNRGMLVLQDDPYHSFDAWYPKAMTKTSDGWSINDDRPSTYDVKIQIPPEFGDVASTGEIVQGKGGQHVPGAFRLQASNVRGFTIYASPKWQTHRLARNGVEFRIHIVQKAEEWAEPMLEAAADVVEFYRKEFGDFPCGHLEMICLGDLTGRAHGSSATCNGITIWLHSRLEEQYQFLVAHEVAHQYFGTSVGIHRRDIAWPVIGLGLMMDHHYMRARGLNDEAIRKTFRWYYHEAIRRGFDTTLSQPVEKPMRSSGIWSAGWNMTLMHGKAFEVCRMLEDLLGEEKFKGVIRKIIKERKNLLLNGAELIDYCEKAHGEPLGWFVADWIDGNRVLDYSVTKAKMVDGRWEVEITRVGDAVFPVTIQAETESGEMFRQRIDRGKRVNRLVFETGEQLRAVVIDGEGVCPDVDDTNNRWTNPALAITR